MVEAAPAPTLASAGASPHRLDLPNNPALASVPNVEGVTVYGHGGDGRDTIEVATRGQTGADYVFTGAEGTGPTVGFPGFYDGDEVRRQMTS